MTDIVDLLPCPFCGSVAVDYIGSPGVGYQVECKGCLAQSPWGDYGYQARAQWNRRASIPSEATPEMVIAGELAGMKHLAGATPDTLVSDARPAVVAVIYRAMVKCALAFPPSQSQTPENTGGGQ